MRYLIARPIISLVTFIVGVTSASIWTAPSGQLSNASPSMVEPSPAAQQSRGQSVVYMSAWQVLVSFEGRDLTKLDRPSAIRLRRAIESLIGKSNPNEFPLIPRLVAKISNAQGRTRYVLIEESPLLFIPGESRLHIHVFNTEGHVLSFSDFSSGWRIEVTGVEVEYASKIDRRVVVVSSQPVINGRDVARQIYALTGDKVVLIRLEDSRGRLIRNEYGAFDHPIGPSTDSRKVEDWENALESDDIAEELSVLTWLGGLHWDPHRPQATYPHEEMAESGTAYELHSRERVKAALGKLMRSDNRWVRSAAELAANVEYYNG